MKRCASCNRENPEDALNCAQCGAPLPIEFEQGPIGTLPPGPMNVGPISVGPVPSPSPLPTIEVEPAPSPTIAMPGPPPPVIEMPGPPLAFDQSIMPPPQEPLPVEPAEAIPAPAASATMPAGEVLQDLVGTIEAYQEKKAGETAPPAPALPQAPTPQPQLPAKPIATQPWPTTSPSASQSAPSQESTPAAGQTPPPISEWRLRYQYKSNEGASGSVTPTNRSVIAIVLAVLSIVSCVCPFSFIPALIAISIANSARNDPQENPNTVQAALTLGIIGLLVSIGGIFFAIRGCSGG